MISRTARRSFPQNCLTFDCIRCYARDKKSKAVRPHAGHPWPPRFYRGRLTKSSSAFLLKLPWINSWLVALNCSQLGICFCRAAVYSSRRGLCSFGSHRPAGTKKWICFTSLTSRANDEVSYLRGAVDIVIGLSNASSMQRVILFLFIFIYLFVYLYTV